MTLNAKDIPITGGNFDRPEPLEPGTYPARVVIIATLGIQTQRPFQGEEKAPCLELLVTYELLDEFLKDEEGNDITDKPRWITETFPFHNLESERAKSTKRYFALDQKGQHNGDWSKLIGVPCMVTVVVDEGKGKNAGKFYPKVSGVSTMRDKEAAKAPPLVNKSVVVDFYSPEKEYVLLLSPWIRKRMAMALDYEGSEISKIIEEIGDAREDLKDGDKKQIKAPTNNSSNEDEDEADW